MQIKSIMSGMTFVLKQDVLSSDIVDLYKALPYYDEQVAFERRAYNINTGETKKFDFSTEVIEVEFDVHHFRR